MSTIETCIMLTLARRGGARKKYHLERLKEREDQWEYSFSRMKDRVARESEECKADL